MRGNVIHQCGRQTIIRLKSELLETRSDPWQFGRVDAGLDHRGHKRRKSRGFPTAFGEKFGMDEVETMERMPLILDAAVHMRAANLAGVPLDRRPRVANLQLFAAFKNRPVAPRANSTNR